MPRAGGGESRKKERKYNKIPYYKSFIITLCAKYFMKFSVFVSSPIKHMNLLGNTFPPGESASHFKTVEFVLREAHRITKPYNL